MLILAFVLASFQDWTPPDNPQPQAILNEARANVLAKNYEDALAKHVWFHENALEISPALTGVRLSFALSSWERLAQKFPPALKMLNEIRDKTEKELIENLDDAKALRLFQDVAAIDRTLGKNEKTSELFIELSQADGDLAKRFFQIARDALFEAEEYKTIIKFMDPDKEVERIKRMFDLQSKAPVRDPRAKALLAEISQQRLIKESAQLVAVLALDDQEEKAKEISVKCVSIANTPELKRRLKSKLLKSLDGKVPKS